MVQHKCEIVKATGTVCGKTFNKTSNFKRHQRSTHQSYSDRLFVCEVDECGGQRFSEQAKLDRHNLMHSNDPEDKAKRQKMNEDRLKRKVTEKAGNKQLKALSVSDKTLVALIEKTINDMQAGYEKTSKDIDAEDILRMATWRGKRKDGAVKEAHDEVFDKLRDVVRAAGYDPRELNHTIGLLYDPHGGKGNKARRVEQLSQEAMDHIIEHQRYNYNEIAEIMEVSRAVATRDIPKNYSETIAKNAGTTWKKLVAAGEEYNRILLKEQLA